MRARRYRWHACGQCLPPGTRHLHLQDLVVCLCTGSRHEALTDRARSRLFHGARRRPTQGACSSLSMALSGGECLPPGPRTCRWLCLCIGSRHEAPTDRASLRLLHVARRRPTQGACSSLPLALMGGECLPPGPRTCKWLGLRIGSRHEAQTNLSQGGRRARLWASGRG